MIAAVRAKVVLAGRAGRAGRAALAVLVAAVALGAAGQRWHAFADLNADRTLSLTAVTRDALRELRGPVAVTIAYAPDDTARVDAVSLLTRYRRTYRRLHFRTLDPSAAPGEAGRLSVDPVFGGVAVEYGGRVEVAATPTEQDITAAIIRLQRPEGGTICFTSGHGERVLRSASITGLRAAASLLEDNGYTTAEIDLAAARPIDEGCAAIVVAAPTSPLGPAASALGDWLDGGGRLLLLGDGELRLDGATVALAARYGLHYRPGLVLEADADSIYPGDPTAPIVRILAQSHPITRRLAPAYFPGTSGISVDDGASGAGGLVATRLLDTTPLSYLETDFGRRAFDPRVDEAGPITVAAAAERTRVDDGRVVRSRLVLTGSAHFAANPFLGELANADLLVRSIDWLTQDDGELLLSTNLSRDRPLRLTAARVRYAQWLFAGVVPALFALAGVAVWAVRRGR